MDKLRTLTDDTLVAMYVSGKDEAFDILLDRYKDRLYSYIYYIIKNADLADDLFQETFVKAIMVLKQGRYVENGKFYSWLTRIARNLIIDQFRTERNENFISNDEAEGDIFGGCDLAEGGIETATAYEETLQDARQMMDLLPENQREVVFMRYFQDMSFKEIADVTGVSINTALGRMRYAILNMRRMAQQSDFTPCAI